MSLESFEKRPDDVFSVFAAVAWGMVAAAKSDAKVPSGQFEQYFDQVRPRRQREAAGKKGDTDEDFIDPGGKAGYPLVELRSCARRIGGPQKNGDFSQSSPWPDQGGDFGFRPRNRD